MWTNDDYKRFQAMAKKCEEELDLANSVASDCSGDDNVGKLLLMIDELVERSKADRRNAQRDGDDDDVNFYDGKIHAALAIKGAIGVLWPPKATGESA